MSRTRILIAAAVAFFAVLAVASAAWAGLYLRAKREREAEIKRAGDARLRELEEQDEKAAALVESRSFMLLWESGDRSAALGITHRCDGVWSVEIEHAEGDRVYETERYQYDGLEKACSFAPTFAATLRATRDGPVKDYDPADGWCGISRVEALRIARLSCD